MIGVFGVRGELGFVGMWGSVRGGGGWYGYVIKFFIIST